MTFPRLQGCTLDYLGATNVFVRENVRRNTNIHIYILELMISSSRGAALIMFKNGSCFMWT